MGPERVASRGSYAGGRRQDKKNVAGCGGTELVSSKHVARVHVQFPFRKSEGSAAGKNTYIV